MDLQSVWDAVESLAVNKAGQRELDIVAAACMRVREDTEKLLGSYVQLSNKYEVIMHTKFPIDPKSLDPVLDPILERLSYLENWKCPNLETNGKFCFASQTSMPSDSTPSVTPLK